MFRLNVIVLPPRILPRRVPPFPASTKEQGESFDELLTWAYTAAGERLHRVGERLRALPAWLSVLLIYGLSRVWGFIVFARGRSAAAA